MNKIRTRKKCVDVRFLTKEISISAFFLDKRRFYTKNSFTLYSKKAVLTVYVYNHYHVLKTGGIDAKCVKPRNYAHRAQPCP